MNGRRLFVALTVAIALVMAACGSSSKSVAPPPAGSSTTTTAPVVSKALGTGVTATSIKVGINLVDFKCIQQFIDFTRPNQQPVYQANGFFAFIWMKEPRNAAGRFFFA